MAVAALDLFVHDHPIKPLLGRLGNQFFSQRNVLLAGKAKAVNDAFHFILGILNPLGNLHLLLAGQQRHLTHLLQVHAHGVI